MDNPKVSLIVSAFNDPLPLQLCLTSLKLQTYSNIEVIVTDNSSDVLKGRAIYQNVIESRFRYIKTQFEEPYSSAELGVALSTGDWIGFPSSDGYQIPSYIDTMMQKALGNDLDFVYCPVLYDRRQPSGRYWVMDCSLQLGQIDKTCFLMKKSLFKGFPGKAPISYSDWYMIEELMKTPGVRIGKCDECLVVHN